MNMPRNSCTAVVCSWWATAVGGENFVVFVCGGNSCTAVVCSWWATAVRGENFVFVCGDCKMPNWVCILTSHGVCNCWSLFGDPTWFVLLLPRWCSLINSFAFRFVCLFGTVCTVTSVTGYQYPRLPASIVEMDLNKIFHKELYLVIFFLS